MLAGKSEVDFADVASTAFPFLEPVNLVLEVVGKLLAIKVDTSGVSIPLGSFDLGGADARGLADLGGLTPNGTGGVIGNLLEKFKEEIRDLAAGGPFEGVVEEAFEKLADQGTLGLKFPLFDDPTTAVRLLFGQPVDLVTLHLPELRLEADLGNSPSLLGSPSFGPLEIGIGGRIEATANIFIGFDTGGIQVFEDNAARIRWT